MILGVRVLYILEHTIDCLANSEPGYLPYFVVMENQKNLAFTAKILDLPERQ